MSLRLIRHRIGRRGRLCLFEHLPDERSHADSDDPLPELDQDTNNHGRPMPLVGAADEDKGRTRVVFIRNVFAFLNESRTALRNLITMLVSSDGRTSYAPPTCGQPARRAGPVVKDKMRPVLDQAQRYVVPGKADGQPGHHPPLPKTATSERRFAVRQSQRVILAAMMVAVTAPLPTSSPVPTFGAPA